MVGARVGRRRPCRGLNDGHCAVPSLPRILLRPRGEQWGEFMLSLLEPSGKAPSLRRDPRPEWAGVARERARAAGGSRGCTPLGKEPPSGMRCGHRGGGAAAEARLEGKARGAAGRGQLLWSPGGGRQMLEPTAKQASGRGGAGGGCGARPGHPLGAHRGGCLAPHPPNTSAWCAPFPRDFSSVPERPTTWEGPPADAACVYAASAPVTGVARMRAGRGRGGGCGARPLGLAAVPSLPGSNDRRNTGREDPFTSSLSRPSP